MGLLRWFKSLFGSKDNAAYSVRITQLEERLRSTESYWSERCAQQQEHYEQKIAEDEWRYTESLEKAAQAAEEHKKKALVSSKAVNRGSVTEEFAAFLPGWKYALDDARHWGVKPFDFVVLDGLAAGAAEITVRFVEVKSGKTAALTDNQKKLRAAVDAGRVTFEIYDLQKNLAALKA